MMIGHHYIYGRFVCTCTQGVIHSNNLRGDVYVFVFRCYVVIVFFML